VQDSALPEDVGAVLEKLQPDCSLHDGCELVVDVCRTKLNYASGHLALRKACNTCTSGRLHPPPNGRHGEDYTTLPYTEIAQTIHQSTTTIFNPLSRVDAKDVQGALDQNDDM
jgi:hypothetical protein